MTDGDIAIRVRGLRTQFGDQVIHDNLDLDVRRGEVIGVVGGSGTGKSVLLRTIIGLNRPAAGTIEVLGRPVTGASREQMLELEKRWGVLFQDGALFSSLAVDENIEVPLKEHTAMSHEFRKEVAALKLRMVGLPLSACHKFPSQLSGGCANAPGWHGRWLSIPIFSSSTNPRLGSIRSAPPRLIS